MEEGLPIRITGGCPTDEETAAIAALFSGLLLEHDVSTAPLQNGPVRSDWDRSRRALRTAWPAGRRWQDR